ncbi:PREDICTED: uncharacterized protein LOC109147330 [Ipomoea nil]|uniref:uncharacterized protein LOC109147330 n=1 Tax=Ipomoea nil TaxID=35883 RepID=UPI000900BECD|nr:PREDICTED: uncharacterized protein LOC109147330 [Ipomoea nil]
MAVAVTAESSAPGTMVATVSDTVVAASKRRREGSNDNAMQNVREIEDLVSQKKPDFVFLMETKVGRIHVERIRVKLGFDGLFYVDHVGLSGGLALLWRKNNTARLISYSRNYIDVEREKRGGKPHPDNLLRSFGETIDQCGLAQLPMTGYQFTWEKGKGTTGWIEERLDKVLATNECCGIVTGARVSNLVTRTSDHSAIFLAIRDPGIRGGGGRRRFQFEMAWLYDEGFRAVVAKSWEEERSQGTRNCIEHCGNREQQLLRGRTDSASLAEFQRLEGVLYSMETQENVYWRQRAKQHWLKGADANTKFYHRIMAKMISHTMKPLMENIISDSQSAFIPSRLITDNILTASEVGHYLNRKQCGVVGWSALKLDMAKAYDHVEWPFLRGMLVALGFDDRWIELIMLCVSTVSYTFLINGTRSESVMHTRGLRHGDPLSPYLFIIYTEGLSLLLQQAQNRGLIHGCRVARGSPPISHLFFADDSMLFFKATIQEVIEIKGCLSMYESLSGQVVNYHKSSICYSKNTGEVVRGDVAQILEVAQAPNFGKYFGLPSFIGRNKKAVFAYIEDKIKQRIGSWNKK